MTTTAMSAASKLRPVVGGAAVVNPEELLPVSKYRTELHCESMFFSLTDTPYLTVGKINQRTTILEELSVQCIESRLGEYSGD